MTTARHYSQPPLTEAIIAFQVELPEAIELPDLERCQDAAYPDKTSLSDAAVHLELENEAASSATSRPMGFLFTSADKKQLFHAHFESFAVHRLAPYEGWEPFRDE